MGTLIRTARVATDPVRQVELIDLKTPRRPRGREKCGRTASTSEISKNHPTKGKQKEGDKGEFSRE